MTLAGLDMNATAARAVSGPAGVPPEPLALDPGGDELPMAVSLQGRHPQVGRPGAALCREYPHLVCQDFLAHLGTSRTWSAQRHRLDAARAMALVFESLRPICADAKGICLALPAYVTAGQAALVAPLARKAKLPPLGTVTAPLAQALIGYAAQPWTGPALLVDVDDHALTWTILKAGPGQVQVLPGKTFPEFNLRAWKAGLVNAISDCCVRHSRRDPRDCGASEQMLFDQLDDVLEDCLDERLVEVIIRATQWCQNLILQPHQVRAFCRSLANRASAEIAQSVGDQYPAFALQLVLVTVVVGRLPGLLPMLRHYAADMEAPVLVLADAAAARGAHALAAAAPRGEVGRGHLDAAVPLPKTAPGAALASPIKRVLPIKSVDY